MRFGDPQWDPNGNLIGPPSYPASAPNQMALPATQTGPGDQGAAVSEIQQKLNRIGYGPLSVNGQFDGDTGEAVKQFQNAENLPVTGVVDTNTYAAINYRLAQLTGQPLVAGQGNPNPLGTDTGMALFGGQFSSLFGGNRPWWQNLLIYGGAAAVGGFILWTLFKGGKKASHSRGLAGEKCKRSPDADDFEAGEVVTVA